MRICSPFITLFLNIFSNPISQVWQQPGSLGTQEIFLPYRDKPNFSTSKTKVYILRISLSHIF